MDTIRALGLDRTYEELKLRLHRMRWRRLSCLDRTYEELKHQKANNC